MVFLAAVALLFLMFRSRYRDIIQELAETQVKNTTSDLTNDAIAKQIAEGVIQYDRIVYFEKDLDGRITALKTNINEINRLKTSILSLVDSKLMNLPVSEVGLPLGSLILPEFFAGSGPRLPVKVLSVSSSDAEFHNAFSEAGINQTSHRIEMEVTITMLILTPVGTEDLTASSTVVVAETVIVGTVPGSYVDVRTGTE